MLEVKSMPRIFKSPFRGKLYSNIFHLHIFKLEWFLGQTIWVFCRWKYHRGLTGLCSVHSAQEPVNSILCTGEPYGRGSYVILRYVRSGTWGLGEQSLGFCEYVALVVIRNAIQGHDIFVRDALSKGHIRQGRIVRGTHRPRKNDRGFLSRGRCRCVILETYHLYMLHAYNCEYYILFLFYMKQLWKSLYPQS